MKQRDTIQQMIDKEHEKFVTQDSITNESKPMFDIVEGGIRRKQRQQTVFGKVISAEGRLVPLLAVLGKRGQYIYYIEQDSAYGSQNLCKASIDIHKESSSSDKFEIELKVERESVFSLKDSIALYFQ